MSLHVKGNCPKCEEMEVSPHTTEHAKVNLRCPPPGLLRQHIDILEMGPNFYNY